MLCDDFKGYYKRFGETYELYLKPDSQFHWFSYHLENPCICLPQQSTTS